MTRSAESCLRIPIREESDVVIARQRARDVAESHGLALGAREALATAVSEIARNIVVHGGRGEMSFTNVEEDGRTGIVIVATDDGPGIRNLDAALQDGYTTSEGLGLGLPSARRLVDELELASEEGCGTRVTLRKWAR